MRLKHLGANQGAGHARTESGLQTHPPISLRLFFRFRSCPDRARDFRFWPGIHDPLLRTAFDLLPHRCLNSNRGSSHDRCEASDPPSTVMVVPLMALALSDARGTGETCCMPGHLAIDGKNRNSDRFPCEFGAQALIAPHVPVRGLSRERRSRSLFRFSISAASRSGPNSSRAQDLEAYAAWSRRCCRPFRPDHFARRAEIRPSRGLCTQRLSPRLHLS